MHKLTLIFLCLSLWKFSLAQPLNDNIQFDGTDDYISLNNMDVASNAITLEALINSSDLSNCTNGQCRIISKALSPSPEDHYWMLSTTTVNGSTFLRFRLKTNGTTTSLVATSGVLSENTWHHIAGTYDGTTMKIYLDGSLVGSSPVSGSITTNPAAAAWIGGNPPTATGHPWHGEIDEVRIWNTARTQAQLQANSNTELTGNEPGLQAYYQFNEGSGQTITDATGNNNTVLGSASSADSNDPTFANHNTGVTIDLNVFLEGPFDPGIGKMTGELLQGALVPQGQPYTGSPWNYPGTEGSGWLPTDYPPETVDWVLVSLRESIDPETEVARAAAVLLENGNISSFNVNLNNSNPVYIMIEHRNHLPIISAQPIPIFNNTISYDFTAQNSYHPTGFGQKQVGTYWMMYGGNADQDGSNSCDINAIDRVFWETVNGLFGVYNPGDYNLDGDINGADRIVFNLNNGIFTTIPKSIDTIDDRALLTCPALNFELDNCNLIANWTHTNPLSTTVNYDVRINGVDPGLSVLYPATTKTIDICSALGITSGSGTLDVKLYYWYDGDLTTIDSTESCIVNYNLGGPSSEAMLTCPSSSFVLTNCNFTVNWTHANPSSTTVNYDLRINGVDPGLSVVYPATSNTINICNAIGISSGSGTLNIELLYWYDGDLTNVDTAVICTIDYDFGSGPSHSLGKTFAQIEADTDLPKFCSMDGDEAYIAEYLYQNPGVCYWNVVTLPNGEKCVVPVDVPSVPSIAIQLPAPSGGNDTQALESVINGNGNNKVFVGSGTYKVNQLDIDRNGTVIHNMIITPASGAGELIHINANDVKLIDCPQDMQNQGSVYLGVKAVNADRFHLIRSGTTNMFHTGGSSGGGVRITDCADFHIAGGIYKNLMNPKETPGNQVSSVCRANAFWIVGGNATDGGYIVNNVGENFQSTGLPTNGNEDAEFLTIQGNDGHLEQVKVYANRCVDAGKRLLKSQADGGATVLSNSYEWRTNSSVLGNRKRLTMIAVHFRTGDVIVRNNRMAINGNDNWGYVMNISATSKSGTNIHFDCNQIEINNPWNGASYDQCILVARSLNAGSTGTDSSQESINCSMNDNTIFGSGAVNYNYWFGSGFDVNSGLLQPTGNTFNLGAGSPRQGIERK